MNIQLTNITPDMAEHFLKTNTRNRSLNRRVVLKYAADMAAGNWSETHQGIAFDKNGRLVDGQHRLAAIIESKKTIRMLVAYGVEPVGIDQLRPRSHLDTIRINGMMDWAKSKVVTVGKAMIDIETGGVAVSTHQMVDFCERNRAAIEFVLDAMATDRKGISSAAVRASVAIASYHIEAHRMTRFCAILYSGIPLNESENAAVILRNYLLTTKVVGSSERLIIAKTAMRCIKEFAAGNPIMRRPTANDLCYKLPDDKKFILGSWEDKNDLTPYAPFA